MIGVSAAYELAGAGHEVVVLDRQPGPALETSFANAGEVSPGYSAPWAGPGRAAEGDQVAGDAPPAARHPAAHRLVDDPLVARHAAQLHGGALRDQQDAHGPPGRIQPRQPARAARGDRHRLRRAHAGHAAALSHAEAVRRQRQRHRRAARERRRLRAARPRRLPAPRAGARARAGEVRRRPAPARRRDRRLPSVHRSASPSWRAQRGVDFRFETTIRTIDRSGERITGVTTDSGVVDADAYLVALGSHSPLLLAPIGVRIPVYPVKGYSITVPITDAAGAPESTVMDETHKVAVTRLGDRIRAGGTAELAGYTLRLHEARRQDAGARRQRSLSRRRRHQPRRVLVRPPADDARRHAGDRRDADRQPVPRHRPRHARLDDGGRHRPRHRRRDLRAQRRASTSTA